MADTLNTGDNDNDNEDSKRLITTNGASRTQIRTIAEGSAMHFRWGGGGVVGGVC